MKKYFITSDVHGYYYQLIEALNNKGFEVENPEHLLIICGDLLDRGPNSLKCLEFVNNLIKQERCIPIRGNHEDLLEEALERGHFLRHDYTNGTADTCYDIASPINNEEDVIKEVKRNTELKYYLEHCVNYYETPNHIFVHSWIPTVNNLYIDNWRNIDSYRWDYARWKNPFEMAFDGKNKTGKTIVFGHWHNSYGYHLENKSPEWGEEALFFTYINEDLKIVGLDACTPISKFVNILCLEEENV